MNGVNESVIHPEEGIYRGVSGQSCLFPNSLGVPTVAVLPAKGSIPIARQLTGTFTSEGIYVRGVGTLFESEIQEGDYLFNGDAAVRKVTAVISDTLLELEVKFGVNVTVAVNVAKCQPQTFKKVQVWNTGYNLPKFNESPIGVGQWFESGGSPFGYDASGANTQLTFTVSK